MKMDLLLLFITFRLHAYENTLALEIQKKKSLFNPIKKKFLDSVPFFAEWDSEICYKRKFYPLLMKQITFSELFVNNDKCPIAFQTYFKYTTQQNKSTKLSYNHNTPNLLNKQ